MYPARVVEGAELVRVMSTRTDDRYPRLVVADNVVCVGPVEVGVSSEFGASIAMMYELDANCDRLSADRLWATKETV